MLFDKLIAKKVAAFESEILQKHYEEVENMYAKMRGWRHDYRHHIQTMKVHAVNGEYEEVSRYLDMLDDDLTNVETVIKTGNRMADAILNSKLSIAAKNEITVKAEAKPNFLRSRCFSSVPHQNSSLALSRGCSGLVLASRKLVELSSQRYSSGNPGQPARGKQTVFLEAGVSSVGLKK